LSWAVFEGIIGVRNNGKGAPPRDFLLERSHEERLVILGKKARDSNRCGA
jgi:hypothetical protein